MAPKSPQSKVIATGRGFEAIQAQLHAATRKQNKDKNLARKVRQIESKHKEKDFMAQLMAKQNGAKANINKLERERREKQKLEDLSREDAQKLKIDKAIAKRLERATGIKDALDQRSKMDPSLLPKPLPKPDNLEVIEHDIVEEQVVVEGPKAPAPPVPEYWQRETQKHFTKAKSLLPTLKRPIELELQRLNLPAMEHVDDLVSKVLARDVIIVGGATGSGKSTQVPQMLLENGFCWHGYLETLPEEERVSFKKHMDGRSHFLIGCTQPRKVAVTSLYHRVSEELGEVTTRSAQTEEKRVDQGVERGGLVGYQVRHDAENISGDTCVKFMTDGILLRELQGDFMLSKYAVIIMDEAHERGVNSDLLLGLLTRSVAARRRKWESGESSLPPLKFLIMSATLNIAKLTEESKLFDLLEGTPPLVEFNGRTFPVVVHFSKVTPGQNEVNPRAEKEALLNATAKKVMQIHKQMPAGTVLVFLTGRDEVDELCNKISRTSDRLANKKTKNTDESNSDDDTPEGCEIIDFEAIASGLVESKASEQDAMFGRLYEMKEKTDQNGKGMGEMERVAVDEDACHAVMLDGNPLAPEESVKGLQTVDELTIEQWAALAGFEGTGAKKAARQQMADGNDKGTKNAMWKGGDGDARIRAIPLYGALSPEDQDKAFQLPVDSNERLVIVATNVAETSLTIPNCRYVVDAGKHKCRKYEPTGLSRFEIDWISQASADQRAGRAGRVGPGHCYRLYSSGVYGLHFQEESPVAMLEVPLDSVLLYLASLGVSKFEEFPFPSRPDIESIAQAEKDLKLLRAIQKDDKRITPVGRLMNEFPLPPRVARAAVHLFQLMNAAMQDLSKCGKLESKGKRIVIPKDVASTMTVGAMILATWSLGGGRMLIDSWSKHRMDLQMSTLAKKSKIGTLNGDNFDDQHAHDRTNDDDFNTIDPNQLQNSTLLARSSRSDGYKYRWSKAEDDVDVIRQLCLGLATQRDNVEEYIKDEFIVRKKLVEVVELSLQIRDIMTSILQRKWTNVTTPWQSMHGSRSLKSPFGVTESELDAAFAVRGGWAALINTLFPRYSSFSVPIGGKRKRGDNQSLTEADIKPFIRNMVDDGIGNKIDLIDYMIKESLLFGFYDQISSLQMVSKGTNDKMKKITKNAYRSVQYPMDNVFVHVNSNMAKTRPRPHYLCYLQLLQQSTKLKGTEGFQITYMTDVFPLTKKLLNSIKETAIEEAHLVDGFQSVGLIDEDGEWKWRRK